jgi:hypothetical protein
MRHYALRATALFAAGVATLLLLVGCTAPLEFTAPCAGTPQSNDVSCDMAVPVSQATIHFDSTFNPSSDALTVQVDGLDATTQLTPAPAPNGTSTLPIPLPSESNGSGAFDTAPIKITVDATCGFFCVYPTKSMTFTPVELSFPPWMAGVSGVVGNVKLQSWTQAAVGTVAQIDTPIQVTVYVSTTGGENQDVRLATTLNGPTSTSIMLTVGKGNGGQQSSTPFYIVAGQTTGTFAVIATATGVAYAGTQGTIVP